MKTILSVLFAVFVILVSIAPAFAIPGTISISGMLYDENGDPLIYYEEVYGGRSPIRVTLDAKIDFYTTETSETPTSTLQTTTTTYKGPFNIRFAPPDELLTSNELWYELSIDTGQDGLDASDLFEDRFQVSSVPYALSAKPFPLFTTHVGYKTLGAAMMDRMQVAPFITPPGGVRFNTMTTSIKIEAHDQCSFGIYDHEGKLVISTGLVETEDTGYEGFLEIPVDEVTLQPSQVYFTGALSSQVRGGDLVTINWCYGIRPIAPYLFGEVDMPDRNGRIPQEFSIDSIISKQSSVPLAIALSYDDGSGILSLGAGKMKVSLDRQPRWIVPRTDGKPGLMTVPAKVTHPDKSTQ